MSTRALQVGFLTLLAAAVVCCRPEILVRLETTVYRDGSLDRALEVVGRTAEGERPEEHGWLAEEARLELDRPEGWARVVREPDRIRAEGFFAPGAPLPGTLLHLDGAVRTADRSRVEVAVEDLSVLMRWTYRETYGDPYGREAGVRAVDGLLDLATEALEIEMHSAFGDRADVERAVRRFRTEGRALALEVLEAHRLAPGPDHRDRREALLDAILGRRGIRSGAREEPEEAAFWEARAMALRSWLSKILAEGASTPEYTVLPEEMTFLPADLADESSWSQLVERTWGGDEELWERARPWVETLEGFYGGNESARYRFEARAALPGTVVATNGMPVPGGAVWFFRGEDLSSEDRFLAAESLEPNDESLRALGARREFEPLELLRLRDLLLARDPQGRLLRELAAAIEAGDLDRLRDVEQVHEDVVERATELADLLDPERGPSPGS